MKLVVITGQGPEHWYVTNRLTSQFEVAAILVCDPPRRRSWWATLRRSPLRFVDKVLRGVFLRLVNDAQARRSDLKRTLRPTSFGFDRADLVKQVGRPKAGDLEAAVADLSPDIIAVYGTGMIPGAVLAKAGTVALNMHTGLSPEYRGVACAIWPLIYDEPHMIGATVHECTQDVDGGRVFQRARANLDAANSLHTVFARAVQAGADAYVDVVRRAIDGSLEGTEQDLSQGREFSGADIGMIFEWKARRALRRFKRQRRLGAD